jgi:ankyrin repeat protein
MDPTDRLFAAARNGDPAVLSQLLKSPAVVKSINDEASRGGTPLRVAAAMGNVVAVNLLLEARADPSVARQEDGETPAYVAAYYGYGNILQALLNANADPSDASHDSPLATVVMDNRADLVEMLIAARADANCAIDGTTPLLIAVENGSAKITQLLLGANADTTATKANGVTPTFAAANRGHADVLALLLHANADPRHAVRGFTPLEAAAHKGHGAIGNVLHQFLRCKKCNRTTISSEFCNFHQP